MTKEPSDEALFETWVKAYQTAPLGTGEISAMRACARLGALHAAAHAKVAEEPTDLELSVRKAYSEGYASEIFGRYTEPPGSQLAHHGGLAAVTKFFLERGHAGRVRAGLQCDGCKLWCNHTALVNGLRFCPHCGPAEWEDRHRENAKYTDGQGYEVRWTKKEET